MSLDLSNLLPGDAAAALRSFPRRYRDALADFLDDIDSPPTSRPDAHQVHCHDGRSVQEVLRDSTRTLQILAEAVRHVTVRERPVLHAAALDASLRLWLEPDGEALDELLGELEAECRELAEFVDQVPIAGWQRTGIVPPDQEPSALTLLREAIHVAAENLRLMQAVTPG